MMTGTSNAGMTTEKWRISVFILDDHEVFRRGLRGLLAAETDIDVVGEAGTVATALQRLPVIRPDVAVLDVRLPDGDGMTVCREIRSALPETVCLMLTAYTDDQALLSAILAGAQGYLLKRSCGSALISAVRTVAAGHSMVDADTTHRVMARVRQRTLGLDLGVALTGQENRILELIADGLTNREIAESMSMPEAAVKTSVSSLFGKLGVRHRTQVAAYAGRLAGTRGEAAPGDT